MENNTIIYGCSVSTCTHSIAKGDAGWEDWCCPDHPNAAIDSVRAITDDKTTTAIALVGSDGIVWGLGETLEAAQLDARNWDCGHQVHELASCVVPAEIASRIESGMVDCDALGIRVRSDAAGNLFAELRAPGVVS